MMSMLIDNINAGALALRDVFQRYHNLPSGHDTTSLLCNSAHYFGFVDIQISHCPSFSMFSNNDDYVAKSYFWNGADAYEPMSLKLWLALAKSSAVIFDIGAYTGVYSLAAASLNRKSKIHSFEALDIAYSRLLLNKSANSMGNIEVHNTAVSDNEEIAEFNVYAGDSVLSTGSSLVEKCTGRSIFQKKRVRAAALDNLMIELNTSRLDLMKIDAEHLIFKGGQKTLRESSPDIICEFLKDARTAEIEAVLSGLGYQFFHINERTMCVNLVNEITIGDSMDTLNTLISKKTIEQIQHQILDLP
jgi:FkbM family methyltransferase